jgi:histone deacetylase 1/2
MENANSSDYLHKIKSAVIENIRRTGKPSVEAFQNIPENPLLSRMDSDGEDEDDDLDADENPDVRVTQRQRDQQIEHEGELYEGSEDEDYKDSLGVRPQPGARRRRNIMDYQNPNAASDGGAETSEATRGLNGESARQRRSVSLASSARPANGTSSRTRTPAIAAEADEDGDVEMEESENPNPSGSAPAGQYPPFVRTAEAQTLTGPPDAPAAILSGSQSPAGVVTPPESPPAPAATTTAAAAVAPAADVEMEEAAPEDAKVVLKEEGEAERDSENVKGEVRTEVAKEEP